MSSAVILLHRPYIPFSFSIITDSKAGDNHCDSGLVLFMNYLNMYKSDGGFATLALPDYFTHCEKRVNKS